MKICKVVISVDKTDAKIRVHEYTGEKKAKSYVLTSVTHVSRNGSLKEEEEINKIVHFDKMMIPTTDFLESHRTLIYQIWCLPEQIIVAKDILRLKVFDMIATIKADFEKMVQNSIKIV